MRSDTIHWQAFDWFLMVNSTNSRLWPAAELELEQPYLRVHRSMAASTLGRLLRDRLREAGYAADRLALSCRGARVEGGELLGHVLDKRWRACAAHGQLLTIEYRLEQAAAQ